MSAEKEVKLNERQQRISDATKATVIIDAGTGLGGPEKKDLYESLLDDGLTVDIIKRLQQFNSDFAVGFTDGSRQAVISALTDNPDLETVTVTASTVNREPFSITTRRKRQGPGTGDNKGKMVDYYGSTLLSWPRASSMNSGQLKAVTKAYRREAEAAFGS